MRVLFPFNPLDEKEADGPFNDEYLRLLEMGVECSLFNYDTLPFDEFRPLPRINDGDIILYRGWMLQKLIFFPKKSMSMIFWKTGYLVFMRTV